MGFSVAEDFETGSIPVLSGLGASAQSFVKVGARTNSVFLRSAAVRLGSCSRSIVAHHGNERVIFDCTSFLPGKTVLVLEWFLVRVWGHNASQQILWPDQHWHSILGSDFWYWVRYLILLGGEGSGTCHSHKMATLQHFHWLTSLKGLNCCCFEISYSEALQLVHK